MKKSINYLTLDAMKNLLDMPDRGTKGGRRNLVLLSLIYDSGARVQEIAGVKVADGRPNKPATVKERAIKLASSRSWSLWLNCLNNT